ncbi:MAG: sigma-E processing peptidase SpoIIGA [Clostridia bacterium]|jgi:stage II sporulation protein GA (sporulation sigma-E factor processing peptidase)|nr:sigma-E processing peptidase SpoIIGA [Clostridia bacterium]
MQYGTYLTNSYIYLNLISKIILSLVMIYIAFFPKNIKMLLKYIIIFYLASFVFGGCAFFLLYYIKPQEILYKNGFLTGTYPIKIAFLGAIVGLTLLNIAFKLIKTRLNKNDMFCEVEILYREKITSMRLMIDTGNLLRDPITKVPVIVVEKEKLRELIDKDVLDSLEKVIYGTNEDLIEKIGEDYISRFRLIPFSSLGKQNGMLIGFKPDEIIIKFDGMETKRKDVIVRYI